MRGLVSYYGTASVAFVYDDIPLLRVRLCLDRTENTAAVVGSVTGVDIHVQRAEAEGAVVARGVAERKDLLAAALADEAVVVFGESLVFHIVTCLSMFFLPRDKIELYPEGRKL